MGKIVKKVLTASTLGVINFDPNTPKLPDPKTAPDPEMQAKAESRRLQRKKRTGRTSTILTGGSSTLG